MVFLVREGGGDMEARRECGGVVCLLRELCRVDRCSETSGSGEEEEVRMALWDGGRWLTLTSVDKEM